MMLPETFAKHFWSRTKARENGCIEWQGPPGRRRYGRVGRKQEPASRVAYRLTHGDPGKLSVCHSCDNPICVNPAHLWLGTQSDNLKDCVLKGRHSEARKTHCKRGHIFDPANTYRWGGSRICRKCRGMRERAYRSDMVLG